MEESYGYKVVFYESASGRCPTEDFLGSLPVKVRAKAAKWLQKLEEFGPDLPRPYADVLRGKIRELRVIFASGQYRFLYFFHERYIIVTGGFLKKTGAVPEEELSGAERAMADFKQRLKEGSIEL